MRPKCPWRAVVRRPLAPRREEGGDDRVGSVDAAPSLATPG
jgi:hypothetical protein